MFKNVSMTGTGLLVLLAMYVASLLGLDFSESQATVFIEKSLEIAGILMTLFGQVSRKDLKFGLFRK
jgi:hypothetical protein